MRAGLLNKTIHIYRPTVTQNEYGEQVQQYNHHYTTRAAVDHMGGSRLLSNDEVVYDYSKTFKVWYYVPVQESDYILYNNKKWRIITIEPIQEHNEKEIQTELINE